MKVKRKEQDIYTPLSWCDRMNSAYQMSIRNSVSAEAILDILTAPSTDSQQELQKRKNGIFSFLKPNAKANAFLKGLSNSELFDALESMAIIKKWSRNKQVFRLDNDFVHELLNTEEVFYEKDSWKFLPYQLFYLDIEDCPEYCEMFSCQGIFVYVHNLFEDGKEKVVIRIYRVNQDMFIKDMFELGNVSDQLGFCNLSDTKEEIYLSNGEEKKITSNIRGLMTMVVQILNYLSSVQPDIEENPQTKKTYRKPAPHTEPKNKYSEIQKWDVGVRFGAAFRAWKKEQESTVPKETSGTQHSRHGKVRPHCRKAHWSHFWYGSGENKVRRAKWRSEGVVGVRTEDMPAVIHKIETEQKGEVK